MLDSLGARETVKQTAKEQEVAPEHRGAKKSDECNQKLRLTSEERALPLISLRKNREGETAEC